MGHKLSAFVSTTVRAAQTAEMTYQFLGLGERVLHVGEAEAGHGDELTHHGHKLVAQLLRSLLLVIQLLQENMMRRRDIKGKIERRATVDPC